MAGNAGGWIKVHLSLAGQWKAVHMRALARSLRMRAIR